MRIATLAYQRHENIGALLQCYALQQTIIKYGHECEVIDYICDAADRTFGMQSLRVKGLVKYLTSCAGVISRLPKRKAFNAFRKKFLLTSRVVDKKNVYLMDGRYDGYIVGSDNVWNSQLTGLDPNYFLEFVSDNLRKASYAASLGLGKVPDEERSVFQKYLKNLTIITVREKAAANDLSDLLQREVIDTCDPTLLLSSAEWDILAVKPEENFKYILVYQMSPSVSFANFAREFAKIKKLPLIYVPFPYGICKCHMKPHIGPREWLGYIKNADFVITDSFHGSVFSSIYERNLIIKISKLGERLKNLSIKLGMTDRMVNTIHEAVDLPCQNYETVRLRIADYRDNGLKTLNTILKHFESL
ncbi:polysaccharide pyruvyl transferase family protein [Arcticibacter tournemirensis]